MYAYIWDQETGGYLLTSQAKRYIASEIRPVFAQELLITGLAEHLQFDPKEIRPFLWAQRNTYFYRGEKIAQLSGVRYGKPLQMEFLIEGMVHLEAVDIQGMIQKNATVMELMVADAKRRVQELYEQHSAGSDLAYIAFSGGKDSVALLDICHQVLPLDVPVVFSDTDMELPDTYSIWDLVKNRYTEREFIRAVSEIPALQSWNLFAPPSRTIRWCCAVHKSTPALMALKKKLGMSAIRAIAFVGVRSDESISRSLYEADQHEGVKSGSQINCMPLLDWGSQELWLYIFAQKLLINDAYRKGLARVGCIMCPESTDRYTWFVNSIYPGKIKPYVDLITSTSRKTFRSAEEITEFIGGSYWQARKSGIVLQETLTDAYERSEGLSYFWESGNLSVDLFQQWIKTLGSVHEDDQGQQYLKRPRSLDIGIPFVAKTLQSGAGRVEFHFRSEDEQKTMVPQIKTVIRKSVACIACRNCEAECPTGAISMQNGVLSLDSTLCTRCLRCYEPDLSCWRYKSMYRSEYEKGAINGINRYNNFGLRENWIPVLARLERSFFPWTADHSLGKKMVEAASAWFQQARLVRETSRVPTPLVEVFKQQGSLSVMGWEFVWIGLANNSVLVKWFITATQLGVIYTIDQLYALLEEQYPTLGKSTVDGGLAALKDMLTKSPLGGKDAVAFPVMKGRAVHSIQRQNVSVDPLTILYSLYLIADKAGRSSFTISRMLVADIDSEYISPLVAFGLSADTFKRQCQGLASKYPDYILCSFTLGLDEVTVNPQRFTPDQIIALALEG